MQIQLDAFRLAPRLRRAAAAALIALLAACGSGSPVADGAPNIVVVVLDTVRADRLSLYGYERDTTPRLKELARESSVYTNAWSPAGWTAPAHASLFTGLRPERHGLLRGTRNYLLAETPSLPDFLQKAGYRTGCFTNNNSISPAFGLTRGFEHVEPLYLELEREYPWAPETHRRALEWVAEQRAAGKPFFLFINDMEAHFPYTPPARTLERFVSPEEAKAALQWAQGIDTVNLVAHSTDLKEFDATALKRLGDLYDAEIRALDRAVGDLVDELRRTGALENTLLVVTADHGENLGDHGLMDHMFSIHKTIRHVPLLVRWPEKFAAGARVEHVVRLEDVFPTILEAAGVAAPPDLDGASLMGDVSGRIARAVLDPPRDYMSYFMRTTGATFNVEPFLAGIRGVFDGRHHYLSYTDGRERLYDVTADPKEERDLAGVEPAVVEHLRELVVTSPSSRGRDAPRFARRSPR